MGTKDVNILHSIEKCMTYVSLCFEVHQPLRLQRSFFWDGSPLREVLTGSLFDFYFDTDENRRIFERVSSKCYLPANQVILDAIKRFQDSERPFKVAYSFSGVFLEQCKAFRPEVLDSFARLVETGMADVMEQTYYHSLSSLYEEKGEFKEQVKMHRELVWDLFGARPDTFENTELIYNDEIASLVESMGYKAIFTEGIVANPNYVYRPPGGDMALLLRNYQLTDDVGFRFSSRSWEEYPLTAEKYSSWIATTSGDCINIFCDYETFGEHHWSDSGIFEFLRYLPGEILKWENLRFASPREIAETVKPAGNISVGKAVSWADLDRDTSCWLGNALQWACFLYEKRLEAPVKESGDQELLRIWRYLGLSDQLYYIFTRGGGPGEVHSYFSPYGNAYDAAVTLISVLSDLHYRLKKSLHLADQPFKFATGVDEFTGDEAYSLETLCRSLRGIDACSIEYHMDSGDLSNWAMTSLGDKTLAKKIDDLRGLRGDSLREGLIKAAVSRLKK